MLIQHAETCCFVCSDSKKEVVLLPFVALVC